MIENIFLSILAIPTVMAQLLILIALAVIAIGGPLGGMLILLGPFAIPSTHTIYLLIEEGFKTADRFILISTMALAANYGTAHTMQLISAARGKKVRGVDLSIFLFSMTGLMISITLVVI